MTYNVFGGTLNLTQLSGNCAFVCIIVSVISYCCLRAAVTRVYWFCLKFEVAANFQMKPSELH